MFRYIPLLVLFCASSALAQSTVQQPMSFDECAQRLQTPPSGAVGQPILTVDTEDVKQVQFTVPDGVVTITCTRSNQQVTIAHQ